MILLSPSCNLIIFFADFQALFRLLGARKEQPVPPTPFPNGHGGLPNPTTLLIPGLPFLIAVLLWHTVFLRKNQMMPELAPHAETMAGFPHTAGGKTARPLEPRLGWRAKSAL